MKDTILCNVTGFHFTLNHKYHLDTQLCCLWYDTVSLAIPPSFLYCSSSYSVYVAQCPYGEVPFYYCLPHFLQNRKFCKVCFLKAQRERIFSHVLVFLIWKPAVFKLQWKCQPILDGTLIKGQWVSIPCLLRLSYKCTQFYQMYFLEGFSILTFAFPMDSSIGMLLSWCIRYIYIRKPCYNAMWITACITGIQSNIQ